MNFTHYEWFAGSSTIRCVYYNDIDQDLWVVFKPNTVWQYRGVPINIYNDLTTAKSAGSFYNYDIKGVYNSNLFSEVYNLTDFIRKYESNYSKPELNTYRLSYMITREVEAESLEKAIKLFEGHEIVKIEQV